MEQREAKVPMHWQRLQPMLGSPMLVLKSK
jgi:hypothetical protein